MTLGKQLPFLTVPAGSDEKRAIVIKQSPEQDAGLIREKVNLETAQIPWRELQRYFAGGLAVDVAADLDLVDVAFQFARDNKVQVEQWLAAGKVAKVNDQQAKAWYEDDVRVWAVVVKPWILVQLSADADG